MKHIIFAGALQLCVMVACFGTQQEEPAWLSVSSDPEGLELFIDGLHTGRTPMDSVRVQPGRHSVEVLAADRYRWSAIRVVDTISVVAGEQKSVRLTTRNEVVVLSDPSNAEVTSEGVLLGRTPYRTFANSSQQTLTWSVQREGYSSSTIRLEPDSGQTIYATLEPLKEQEEMPDVLEGPGSAGIRDRQWSIATGAILVASSVAAAYLKDRANKAYSAYQQTQDPQALNDVRKYDRWSGVASLTTQISFAAFAYLLMAK